MRAKGDPLGSVLCCVFFLPHSSVVQCWCCPCDSAQNLLPRGKPTGYAATMCVCSHLCRCNTVMTPVIASLQQHIAAATSAEPVSPDDASFRQELLPQLTGRDGAAEECVCCRAENASRQSGWLSSLGFKWHKMPVDAEGVAATSHNKTTKLLCQCRMFALNMLLVLRAAAMCCRAVGGPEAAA